MVFFRFGADMTSRQVLIEVTSKTLRLKFLKPALTETCLRAPPEVAILFVSLSLYSMESSGSDFVNIDPLVLPACTALYATVPEDPSPKPCMYRCSHS